MAVFPSIPMDEFLSQYPQALRNWIEQDLGWKVEEIDNIMVEDVIDRMFTRRACVVKIDGDKHLHALAYFEVDTDNGEWKKVTREVNA